MKMHLEGMLDRDQRTIKSRMYVSDEVSEISENFRECSSHDDSSNSSSINASHRTRKSSTVLYSISKRGYLFHTFQRLKKVLLVLAYLTIITLPTSNSAPTLIKMSARMREPEKWINPNKFPLHQDVTDFKGTKDDIKLYLSRSRGQAQIALNRANNFKDKFAHDTFNRNFNELFEGQSYPWFLKAPKIFGEDVALDHLRDLKINETFLDVYGYLQSVAVGMEQVVWDQEDRHDALFPKDFKEQESNLILVLCELQTSMYEMNIRMRPDIPRNIMDDKFRFNMDNTQTNARDFIIFREYINTLEYVVQAFDYLERDIEKL